MFLGCDGEVVVEEFIFLDNVPPLGGRELDSEGDSKNESLSFIFWISFVLGCAGDDVGVGELDSEASSKFIFNACLDLSWAVLEKKRFSLMLTYSEVM